jgi:hypothetical protein
MSDEGKECLGALAKYRRTEKGVIVPLDWRRMKSDNLEVTNPRESGMLADVANEIASKQKTY